MSQTFIERLTQTAEGMRYFQQERAIQEVTDLICHVMDEQRVSRAELARRLGKSKGYITQLLDGRTNMTIRTVSEVFGALERAVHFQDGPLSATVAAAPLFSIQEGLSWGSAPSSWPQPIPIGPQSLPATARMAG